MKKRNKEINMEDNLGKAISIAAKAFEGKTDKAGKPYILHCLRVMNAVNQEDSELMQIAVLHDVIEDTDITRDDLVFGCFMRSIC